MSFKFKQQHGLQIFWFDLYTTCFKCHYRQKKNDGRIAYYNNRVSLHESLKKIESTHLFYKKIDVIDPQLHVCKLPMKLMKTYFLQGRVWQIKDYNEKIKDKRDSVVIDSKNRDWLWRIGAWWLGCCKLLQSPLQVWGPNLTFSPIYMQVVWSETLEEKDDVGFENDSSLVDNKLVHIQRFVDKAFF